MVTFHELKLDENGKVWARGLNKYGQLGNGSTDESYPDFVQVQGIAERVISVAVGEYHNLALGESGTVYSWGRNDVGQLGHDTKSSSLVAKPVKGLETVHIDFIAAHGDLSFAVSDSEAAFDTNELVFGWGDNSAFQIRGAKLTQKLGIKRSEPVLKATLVNVNATRVSILLKKWAWKLATLDLNLVKLSQPELEQLRQRYYAQLSYASDVLLLPPVQNTVKPRLPRSDSNQQPAG